MVEAALDMQGESSRVERRRNKRVATILKVAGETLAEVGYHNLSLERVADALDLSKTSLYHYFPSKDALIDAAIDHMASEVHDRLAQLTDPRLGDAVARLRSLIAEQLTIVLCEYPEATRLFTQSADWPLAHVQKVKTIRRDHYDIFKSVVLEGVEDGTLHPVSVEAALHCMHGAINDAGVWSRSLTPAEMSERIEELTDTVMMLFGRSGPDSS